MRRNLENAMPGVPERRSTSRPLTTERLGFEGARRGHLRAGGGYDMVTEGLLPWYAANRRDLPWRKSREPYAVWVSEIMLQQTRVEAVIPYYRRFMQALPDVRALAEAPEEQLLKLWEGLGYYSRVRNMQAAAGQIVKRGGFPQTAEELKKLKGFGDYTAGAVASIAFAQRAAAVDGNVLRVWTRIERVGESIKIPSVKRACTRAVLEAMPEEADPGQYNQALMELGATVCTPRSPDCAHCPVQAHCGSLCRRRGGGLSRQGSKARQGGGGVRRLSHRERRARAG